VARYTHKNISKPRNNRADNRQTADRAVETHFTTRRKQRKQTLKVGRRLTPFNSSMKNRKQSTQSASQQNNPMQKEEQKKSK
jgi:hypothetical protein